MTHYRGDKNATSVKVALSDKTHDRLKAIAERAHKSEALIAAILIEAALTADELEVAAICERLAQADAGGPFAGHDEVLAWLKALSRGPSCRGPEGDHRILTMDVFWLEGAIAGLRDIVEYIAARNPAGRPEGSGSAV